MTGHLVFLPFSEKVGGDCAVHEYVHIVALMKCQETHLVMERALYCVF